MDGDNKSDLSKIKLKMEEDSKSFWIPVIFVGFITLCYLALLYKLSWRKFLYQEISEYWVYQVFVQDWAIWSLVFWLFGAIIIFSFWHAIRKEKRNNASLYKHVNSWTIIVKKAEITKFEYYYSKDDDYHTSTKWYYIIAMSWDSSYKSDLLEGAKLSEWYGKISVDKSYFQGNNNLVEENKLLTQGSENNVIISKLWWILNNQNLYGTNDTNWWHLPSLMCEDKKWDLWDEVTIYVDPDNPENYKMEI